MSPAMVSQAAAAAAAISAATAAANSFKPDFSAVNSFKSELNAAAAAVAANANYGLNPFKADFPIPNATAAAAAAAAAAASAASASPGINSQSGTSDWYRKYHWPQPYGQSSSANEGGSSDYGYYAERPTEHHPLQYGKRHSHSSIQYPNDNGVKLDSSSTVVTNSIHGNHYTNTVATTNVPVSERTVAARSAFTTSAAHISPAYLENHLGDNHESAGNWKNLDNGHSLNNRRSSSVGNFYTGNTGDRSNGDADNDLSNRLAYDRDGDRRQKFVVHLDGSCSEPMASTRSTTPPQVQSDEPPAEM